MSVSFLNPWALAALPLAAAPWLLHRWAASKAKVLPFPSLELLRRALRESFASSLLSERVLLALRTLLALALVLLLSRPALRGGGGGTGGGPWTVVLGVDVSASMGARAAGRTRLSWALEEARAFSPRRGSGEKAGFVAFSDRLERVLPPTDDAAVFERALASLAPTPRPTRVEAGLSAAAPLLAGAPGEKAFLLLTDGGANGWRDAATRLPAGVLAAAALSAPPAANAGITSVGRSGGPSRLHVAGWGAAPPGPRGWTLSWDGRPAAQGRLDVGLAPSEAPLPSPPARPFARGEAVLDPDAFAADDSFFFLPPPAARLGVLVVDGAPALSPTADEAYYLEPVLETLAKSGGRYKVIQAAALAEEPLSGWSVLMLANVGEAPAAAVGRVRVFVENGGGLWATAGDRFRADVWGPLLPARPTGRIVAGGSARFPPEALRHPLGRRLSAEGGFEWGRVETSRLWEADPLSDADTLLADQRAGRPLLVLGKHGRGRTAFLATSIDRDESNLPSRPLFPVLCRELWSALSGDDASETPSLVVDRPWEGALPPGAGDVVVERPDGSVEAPSTGGGRFRYEKTDAPGFYTLRARRDPAPIARAAVNVDRDSGEGDPALIAPAEAARLLGVEDLAWIASPAPVRARFEERARGKPLEGVLARVLAFLLLLETLVLAFRPHE